MNANKRETKDYIELNKTSLGLSEILRSQELGIVDKPKSTERVKIVKLRRQQIETNRYKERIFQLVKWDVLKKKRIEKEYECKQNIVR